jgi:hypothetical protein
LIEREANSAGKTRIYIAFYFVINWRGGFWKLLHVLLV